MVNNESNKLALIVSYYLARFNTEGLVNLGYESFNQAFEDTAFRLGVKKNYVKLRRDEFDPEFKWRVGWKRPMDRQIVNTIELFKEIDELGMRDIVNNILKPSDSTYRETEEIVGLLKYSTKDEKGIYAPRGITGDKAEQYFRENYNDIGLPIYGVLRDTTKEGCGYDFEISNDITTYFIEVKGLAESKGGILFTDKEWNVAVQKGDYYYLVIVKNVDDIPSSIIIKNPGVALKPKKNIYTVLQIQWQISNIEL